VSRAELISLVSMWGGPVWSALRGPRRGAPGGLVSSSGGFRQRRDRRRAAGAWSGAAGRS